jgi:hypothetical protein
MLFDSFMEGKLNNDNSSSSSNWRPSTQMESGCSATNNSEMEVDPHWRNAFPVVSREKIISKLMSTLQKHSPINAKGMGEQNLKSIALRFEDKIYSTATSKVQDICVVHICYYFLQLIFMTEPSDCAFQRFLSIYFQYCCLSFFVNLYL